jgi:hypothetical protein
VAEEDQRRPSLRERLQETNEVVEQAIDHLERPEVLRRLASLRVPGTAEVTGVADVPAREGEDERPECVLLRLQVSGSDGRRFESAVLQEAANGTLRQLAPGLVVAVRAHRSEPRVAVSWRETAALLGRPLTWQDSVVGWPGEADWPAAGAIEVRHHPEQRERLEERRRSWVPVVGAFVRLDPADTGRLEGRRAHRLTVVLPEHEQQATFTAAVPDLVGARLVAPAPDGEGLVWREGTPLDLLVDPAADPATPDGAAVAVDWERWLARPENRSLPPIG